MGGGGVGGTVRPPPPPPPPPPWKITSKEKATGPNLPSPGSSWTPREGGYSHFFSIRRLGPSIYHSPQKNIRDFSNPKNILHSVPWPQENSLKCIEMTPSPILWWPQKISTESSYPQKYSFFWKSKKIEMCTNHPPPENVETLKFFWRSSVK